MIIYEEMVERLLKPIKHWRVPVQRSVGLGEPLDPDNRQPITVEILFSPERSTAWDDEGAPYIEGHTVPYRWYCMDCYRASGDRTNTFSTPWERRESIADGQPTEAQQRTMSEHAKQHGIIWLWVRGLKRK